VVGAGDDVRVDRGAAQQVVDHVQLGVVGGGGEAEHVVPTVAGRVAERVQEPVEHPAGAHLQRREQPAAEQPGRLRAQVARGEFGR
jgi:hypothetical protein